MCIPKRSVSSRLSSPRSVEALHALAFARCVLSAGHHGVLTSEVYCTPCFEEKIDVRRRDLYEYKLGHFIIEGDRYRILACKGCRESIAAIRPVSVCRPCTTEYFNILSQLDSPITVYGDPFVVRTNLANWHVRTLHQLRRNYIRPAADVPS